MTFKDIIKQYRQSRGLTQAAMAKELGFSQQTIASWESGRSRPKPGKLEQIHKRLTRDNKEDARTLGSHSRPLLPELDFSNLSAERFEDLVCDLAGALWPKQDVYRWGKQGR